MINFSNYYCLVILLIVRITTCQINDPNTTDIEIGVSDDSSGSADDVSGSYLKFDPDICELPIDEGDCRNESLGTDEDSDNDSDSVINELYQLDDLNEFIGLNELNQSNEHDKLSESNESNSFYFGYNKNTKNCEQFIYDGCGGNANRFDTINDCRKTCYTPLKNFLAKVTDLLVSRVTNGTSELPAT